VHLSRFFRSTFAASCSCSSFSSSRVSKDVHDTVDVACDRASSRGFRLLELLLEGRDGREDLIGRARDMLERARRQRPVSRRGVCAKTRGNLFAVLGRDLWDRAPGRAATMLERVSERREACFSAHVAEAAGQK